MKEYNTKSKCLSLNIFTNLKTTHKVQLKDYLGDNIFFLFPARYYFVGGKIWINPGQFQTIRYNCKIQNMAGLKSYNCYSLIYLPTLACCISLKFYFSSEHRTCHNFFCGYSDAWMSQQVTAGQLLIKVCLAIYGQVGWRFWKYFMFRSRLLMF